MSTYDLEEQEQLAALKAWWKENGGAILLGATMVLAAIAAWNGWMWYQRSQSAQAAVLYDTLQKAARASDLQATRDDNEPDAALKILEAKPQPGFEALYASQRGDILATQKKRSEARAAYKAALEKAEAGALRDALRLKLEGLGDG